ncbi:helix-turn-helix domain-containing protein [Streptomyces sp. NRRL WC-3744]|uniref:helix-turn-helix domain-containing protein n=1 Tax=Streptomyces sp. NRRL WC-3744 TaxID=1463935 RepID=UPI000A4A336E|nr:helix-turn-helix domain-containing protein [Streptomyces sp. NRRL WC-3744]
MDSLDSLHLLAHPIRLRIVHAMSGGRLLTTSQLCARIGPDVDRTHLAFKASM